MNHNNNISVNVNHEVKHTQDQGRSHEISGLSGLRHDDNVNHEVKHTQDEGHSRNYGISGLSGLRHDNNAPSASNESSTHPTFNHKMGDTVNPYVDNNTDNFTGIQIKKNSSSNYA